MQEALTGTNSAPPSQSPPVDSKIWAANVALVEQLFPGRICLQGNGLRPTTKPDGWQPIAKITPVGQQTWGSVASMGGTIQNVIDIAGAMPCSYLEIYAVDCTAANDPVFAAWVLKSPRLPAAGFHRRIGAITRRLSLRRVMDLGTKGDRRAASENGAGNRRHADQRIGPTDRRAQPPSRP